MKSSNVTVEGVVERVTFESESSGFRVIKLAVTGRAERLSVVGTFPPAPVGARVRIRGQIEQDKKHGEQLRAESVIELAPETLAGLEKYLASGLIKGVGPKIAARIVATFGLDALRVLDEEAGRLEEVEGLGEKRRTALARAWREQRAIRDVMVFLQAHGASPSLAARIVRRYGAHAMNVVSREPYRLALDVSGVGFKTADRIAATIGVLPDSPERMHAGVLQVVHDLTLAGHVWTGQREVTTRAAQMLGLEPDDESVHARLDRALDASLLSGRVAVEAGVADDDRAVYAADMHAAEVRLATCLTELASARAEVLPGSTSRSPTSRRARASSSHPSSGAPSRKQHGGRCSSSRAARASARRRSSAPSSPSSRRRGCTSASPRRPAGRPSDGRGHRRRGDDDPPVARVRPEVRALQARQPLADRRRGGRHRRGVHARPRDGRRRLPGGRAGHAPPARRRRRPASERGPRRRTERRHRLGEGPVRAPDDHLPAGRAEPHRHERPPHQRGRAAARGAALRRRRLLRRRAPRPRARARRSSSSSPRGSPSASASTRCATSKCSRR